MSDKKCDSEHNYEVGYKKPPQETRFRPGHSGNPKGRPQAPKTVNDAFYRELDQMILVREGGRSIKMTVREALTKSMLNHAIKGNASMTRLVLKHLSDNPPPPEIDPKAEEQNRAEDIKKVIDRLVEYVGYEVEKNWRNCLFQLRKFGVPEEFISEHFQPYEEARTAANEIQWREDN